MRAQPAVYTRGPDAKALSVSDPDILIVGGGIAGLSCGGALTQAGARVRVLERSRGVGGRCATRRIEGQAVDHGLCFLHGSDPQFLAAVRNAEPNAIEGWPRSVEGDGVPCLPRAFRRGESRLALSAGVSAFPKSLAAGLDVRLESDVVEVQFTAGIWTLTTASGQRHRAPQLVLTQPAPRAIEMLRQAAGPQFAIPADVQALLGGIGTKACLTVAAGYTLSIPEPAWEMFFPPSSPPVHLISHDSSKRIAPAWRVLVLQALPCFSRLQLDQAPESWSRRMLDEAARLLGSWAGQPAWISTQRWRHARLSGGGDLHAPLLVDLPGGGRVGITGEAFAPGGGAEGAWHSGRAMASRLIRREAA